MRYPVITIDKAKLEHNARALSELLSKQGMRLVGVAKGVCAHPAVVEAMVSGGAAAMGDSRIDNLKRIREQGYWEKQYSQSARLPCAQSSCVTQIPASILKQPS